MAVLNIEGMKFGQAQIADEVISVIAATAALEVDGVAALGVHNVGEFVGDMAEAAFGVRNLSRGVKIEINADNIFAEISIAAKFGVKVQDVSEKVQKRVKTALETMTGLRVTAVNVNVTGVSAQKPDSKSAKVQNAAKARERRTTRPVKRKV